MKHIGIIFGKFYPIHLGHINMIFEATLNVDELHIVICSDTERDEKLYKKSLFTTQPTVEQRIEWVKTIFIEFQNITVHHLNEDGIPEYPNGWNEWANRVISLLSQSSIKPTLIFSSEPQDKYFYETYFHLPVNLIDPERGKFSISATKIRENPYQYWNYIPEIVQPFFTKKILLSLNSCNIPLITMLSILYKAPIIDEQNREDYFAKPILLFNSSEIHLKYGDIDAFITDNTELCLKQNSPMTLFFKNEDSLLYNFNSAKNFIEKLLSIEF